MHDEALAAAEIGRLVVSRRANAIADPQPQGVTIAVGTAAHGLHLEAETRLVKTAILYADHVILFSPAAAMLASAQHLGKLDDDQMMAYLRLMAPALGQEVAVQQACAEFDRLRRARRRSRQDIQNILSVQRTLRAAASEFAAAADNLLSEARGEELAIAVDCGLVEVDPIIDAQSPPSDAETTDDLTAAYIRQLGALLHDSRVYPLFDDRAGALVRAGIAEGLFNFRSGTVRRGTQAATAASFVERMPALPKASMSEVIGVRATLNEPLARFRRAVIKLAKIVDSPFPDEDLGASLQDLYEAEVAPAIEEIASAFARDLYLREFLGVVTEDVRAIITQGAGLALGALGLGHLPAVAAASIGASAAAGSVAFKTAARVAETRGRAEQHQLYLLYTGNERLVRRR